jgi:Fur family transcriptional regulator, ferric uptake regulator
MSKVSNIIFNLINNSESPVDFGRISEALLLENETPNKTTIYRNLEKLESEGHIKKVLLSDQKQYWEKSHSIALAHFHLICNLCKKIQCREFSNMPEIQFSNFLIQKSEYNLFGICQNCQ